MTITQAFILGIVQGLTEFLPISSSGHLTIVEHIFQLRAAPLFFDVLLHAGTLLAVIVFFFSELKSVFRKKWIHIFVASIPAFIFGILIEPYFENYLKEIWVVVLGLIITAIFLISTLFIRSKPKSSNISIKQAFIVGLAQALAIIPGISRSGSTVVTGMHQGLTPNSSFSFSFILSIPAILGALLLQVTNLNDYSAMTSPQAIIGFTSALIVGLLALKLLKIVINRSKLHYFGIYCVFIAGISLILL